MVNHIALYFLYMHFFDTKTLIIEKKNRVLKCLYVPDNVLEMPVFVLLSWSSNFMSC